MKNEVKQCSINNDNKPVKQQPLINYTYLINKATNVLKEHHYSQADYYLYLSLLSSNIDLISILKVLSLRSVIYYDHYKDPKMLLYFSMKIMKLFSLILEYINDSQILIDISKVFYYTGILLQLLTNCNPVLPFYLFTVGRRLIQLKKIPIDATEKEYYDKHYKECKEKLTLELKNIKESYYNILTLNGEEFLHDEHDTLYTVLNELHKSTKDFDHTGNTIKIGEECYIISHKWRRKYKHFLEKLLSWKNSPLYYNTFINKGFDARIQYYNFIEEENNQIYHDCPYICSINNFWLESFKDACTITSPNETMINNEDDKSENEGDDYTNVFLNSFIKQEDYAVVTKDTWDELVKNFGCINEIKRYKLTDGEIEIHLKRLKIMVLNRNVIKENIIHLLRPKVIQMSKEKTVGDLIIKMNKCLIGKEYFLKNKDKTENAYNIYLVDTSKMGIIQRKQLIFEILMSYNQIKINHINLPCNDITNNSTKSIESLGDKCLIIMESKGDPIPFIHPISNDNIISNCSACHKEVQLQQCSQCSVNLINSYSYCSSQCEKNDSNHQLYHKEICNIIYIRTTILELTQISLQSLLPLIKESIGNHGIAGLINISNNSYINSIIQCLTHCEELTKYFLSKRFINEINQLDHNFTTTLKNNADISNAYYDLLKMLWLDNSSLVNPTSFINAISLEGYYDIKRDPYTFLVYLLNKLHMNLNRNNIGRVSTTATDTIEGVSMKKINRRVNIKKSDIENSDILWNQYKSKEDSIIVDLFHGQLKHIIICPYCLKNKITFEPFADLSLVIPSELYLIKFAFFPLLVLSLSSTEKEINSTNSNDIIENTIDDNDLIYYEYEATVSKSNIKSNDFTSIILSNNAMISSPAIFDFVLLKPNKQWLKFIEFDNDNSDDIFNYLKQGYHLVIYQRKDNHTKNIYIYPSEFQSQTKYLIVPYTQINFLSYPIAINMTNKHKVNDCYSLIKHLLRNIINSSTLNSSNSDNNYNQFKAYNSRLITKENEEYNSFRLYIYNTKKANNDYYIEPTSVSSAIVSVIGSITSSLSSKSLNSIIFDSDNKASTICDFCGQNCDFCSFLDRFYQNEDFDYIQSHITNDDHPLILYAQMLYYNKRNNIYKVIRGNDTIKDYTKQSSIIVKRSITLDDCLNRFINEDKVDNGDEWYCSNCQTQNGNANIKHEIFKAPPYLIIHLKQHNNINENITVSIDSTLDIGKYLNIKGKGMGLYITKEDSLYDLSSECYYYSTNKNSHEYASLCKHNNSSTSPWIHFQDDHIIELCSFSSFKEFPSNSKDYILFYKKRNII